jgi:hypothetical protein
VARLVLDGAEIEVGEDLEDVLSRIVSARDGVRRGSGAIVAPPGWMVLSTPGTDEPVYVQVSRIGCVRDGLG